MRRQPPGPLRARRLRDETPDTRLPELRFTPSAPPPFCAPEPAGTRPLQLPAETPAPWTRRTPSESDSPAFPGSTPRRGRLSRGAQRAGGPPCGSECQDLSGTKLYLLPHTYARQLEGGAHSRRQTPGWSGTLSVSNTTTPNSTLSIKVSKLAQAPPLRPATHSPEAQCAQGSALAAHSDLGSGGAQPSRRTRTLEGRAGHLQTVTAPGCRSPHPEPAHPKTRRRGGAARGPKERREEGRWFVG